MWMNMRIFAQHSATKNEDLTNGEVKGWPVS
jgi:hypothetical protein